MTNQSTTQQKKKSSWGKKILIGVAILVVIGIIANLGSDETASASASSSSESSSTEPAKSKQWTEVLTLKGSGTKNSPGFHLSGGKARVKYTFKASEMGMFSVYVVPEGVDLNKEGGFPEVDADKSESSETYITKEAGNYYLNVNSANGDWTIVVEEEK